MAVVAMAEAKHAGLETEYTIMTKELAWKPLPVELNGRIMDNLAPTGRSQIALVCREFGRIVALGRGLRQWSSTPWEGDDASSLEGCPVLWKGDVALNEAPPWDSSMIGTTTGRGEYEEYESEEDTDDEN